MKKIFVLTAILLALIVFIAFFNTNEKFAQNGSQTSDIQLLARAINGEARGEDYEGQVAVGAVILNRVKHPDFPNTIAGVIYEPGAFTAVSDGQINHPTNGCVYYFNPNTATNKWIWSKTIVKTIGKHNFCK